MEAYRIGIKFYLSSGSDVDPETWFRVLNTWIPVSTEEILIDVADYSHVHNGPVTLLVGYEANYGIDSSNGRAGLLYTRKQPLTGDMGERIRSCIGDALKACRRLEQEEDLKGSVVFDGGELEIILNDRLNAPNTAETFSALQPALNSVLDGLYGGAQTQIEHDDDPRRRFAVRIKIEGDWEVDNVLENMSIAL